jgi:hypothetical protein
MTQVEIRVKGLDRLTKKLGRLATAKLLLPTYQEAVKDLQRDMMEYPHAKSGSKYKRTNRLKGSWTSKAWIYRVPKGVVGTNVKYAPYVQSATRQAKVHKQLWRKHTDAYVLGQRSRIIINNLQSDINRFWNK